MASPLDAVALKYLSLVQNFLKTEDPRKLVQFMRVQRLLTMKAIVPDQWVKLVSELFAGNATLLKATAALTRISQSNPDPNSHLAYKVATMATRAAANRVQSPTSPIQTKKTPPTSVVPHPSMQPSPPAQRRNVGNPFAKAISARKAVGYVTPSSFSPASTRMNTMKNLTAFGTSRSAKGNALGSSMDRMRIRPKSRSPKVAPQGLPKNPFGAGSGGKDKGAMSALLAARRMQSKGSSNEPPEPTKIVPRSNKASSKRRSKSRSKKLHCCYTRVLPFALTIIFMLMTAVFVWVGLEFYDIRKVMNRTVDPEKIKIEMPSSKAKVYGEITLLYDSSFQFTAPYQRVFRNVIADRLTAVNGNAIDIVNTTLLISNRRRLSQSYSTLPPNTMISSPTLSTPLGHTSNTSIHGPSFSIFARRRTIDGKRGAKDTPSLQILKDENSRTYRKGVKQGETAGINDHLAADQRHDDGGHGAHLRSSCHRGGQLTLPLL